VIQSRPRFQPTTRAGLERLSRYVLRPPFAQERLRLRSDGRVALELLDLVTGTVRPAVARA
jgi:hypothetical protein